MTAPNSSSSHRISEAVERLRELTRSNIQASWHHYTADLKSHSTGIEILPLTQFDPSNWPFQELNTKGHIAWPLGRQVLWLAQKFIIPDNLQGYPLTGLTLRLVLTWWAEDAKIFVNGQLVQEGDLFDSSARLLLSLASVPGEEIAVVLRLVSPEHDHGALMRSFLLYESTTDQPDPGFVADELAVAQIWAACKSEQLDTLAAAIAEIDWTVLPDRSKFERSLSTLRQNLLRSRSKIGLLGHAHLDMAWLWPVSETWKAAQRTFESVLKLQQEFSDLIFCHSTPAIYAWIEQHRPDLFAAIQQQVAAGRWEVVGGMWVEPELNLINGESIVRQILYGQRYVQEKFGGRDAQFGVSTVAWLPDSFGFCWQLPQFLSLGGIEYFVTQKLRWNDTTKFPYGTFWWQAPDGSQIFSLMSNPIGEGIEPIKMATYAFEWEKQTGGKNALWLLGVGDHGGGPTRDMLEVAKRWQQSPFFPHLEFTTAQTYLQNLKEDKGDLATLLNPQFPTWNDELYLEFHRGCYTTHAEQKRWNRRCEGLLYQAELFASLATISTGKAYPKTELEDAWKKVLFNQFHDILPGTSIPQVFVEANQAWQEVEQVGSELVDRSLRAIASQIIFPPPPQPDALPVVVFNSLNWQRSEVVAVSLSNLASLPREYREWHWQIYDSQGHQLTSQLGEASKLLFLATDIPAVGYRIFWLCHQEVVKHDTTLFLDKDWILENELLRVVVDAETGNFVSVFDKISNWEILNQKGGNQLQAFQDTGQYWDAWNIDPNYAQHSLPPTHLKSIEWVDQGPLQQRLRVVRQMDQSEFCQDYVLQAESPIVKIATTVDWQSRHVLVKAAFSFNVEADYATYEIPCGAIQRSTRPKTPAEQAKWEVPALHWADLSFIPADSELRATEQSQSFSDSMNSPLIPSRAMFGEEPISPNIASKSQIQNGYGVSLLNDCKYGYDSQPNQLRLTLLRSPSWPDPEADQGIHQFTYALYPHISSWQSAHTVRRGYELNLPMQVMVCPPVKEHSKRHLPPVGQLLDLSAENLILMAFKQSEADPQQWILRCYECHGEEAQLKLQSNLSLAIDHSVDLLERPSQTPEKLADRQTFKILPWKIASFAVSALKNKISE